MKKVIWEVQYPPLPTVQKYCKKCGKKADYICSGLFRVNAQRKYLDIWLIYKCAHCDTTWNMTIYSRINSKSIDTIRLEQFHENNSELVREYAMDFELLNRNGAEVLFPEYNVVGEEISVDIPTQLHIKSDISSKIKVSKILRDKLILSRKVFDSLLADDSLVSINGQDLRKCKLGFGVDIIINKKGEII